MYPHLGRVIDDEGNEITLPRKADELDWVHFREPESAEGRIHVTLLWALRPDIGGGG